MRKSVSRTLYLLALVLGIAAAVLIILGIQGSTFTSVQSGPSSVGALTSVGNPGLLFAGIGASIVGGVLLLIAWIGALVRTAQLGRWGWFVCLIVLSGITMLLYIFIGPTTPANAQYPPQQYPRQ